MLIVLQAVLLGLIACSLLFYVACAISIHRFFAARSQELPATDQSVSVLIPVCGIDEESQKNWESFCQQDYENYEVLFGVMDSKDPAVPVLKDLVERFPDRTKLMCGLTPLGINHQISNLMHLLKVANHEIIVLADTDIRVGPTYLRKVTTALADSSIGVVTCGYLDLKPNSLAAALAAFGRALEFIPSVLLARSLDRGLRFAIGPTIATRKSVLSEIGGLQDLVNRIGSDYHIGSRAAAAGYRVELSTYVLKNGCGHDTVMDVVRREVRWARSIRCNRGPQYYGIGITFGIVYSLMLTLVSGLQFWTILICLGVISLRLIQALITIHRLNCPTLLRWLWALPLRELVGLVVWIGGTFGYRIYWRGRYLKLGAEGILTEIEQPQNMTKKNRLLWKSDMLFEALKSFFAGY